MILYNKLRSENPDAAALTSRRVQQLAAVVLVLSKAVEGVVEALQVGVRPQMATSSWSPQTSRRAGRRSPARWSTCGRTSTMTVERRGNLRVMQGGRLRVTPDPRCAVAAQAVMCGPQDIRVTAMTAEATGWGYGHVCLRVGRVLIYLEDHDALRAWRSAVDQAVGLADAAFGPELPPARYERGPLRGS